MAIAASFRLLVLALTLTVSTLELHAQSLTVRVVGDMLHLRASGLGLIEARVADHLRDGRAVRVGFAVAVLEKAGGRSIAQATQSFNLSFDIWEQRYAVTKPGATPRSVSAPDGERRRELVCRQMSPCHFRQWDASAATCRSGHIGVMATTEFAEKVSPKIFGRDIPQTLLLHSNDITADCLDEILTRFKARGYRFVTLDAVMADPAYQTKDTYITKVWTKLAGSLDGEQRPGREFFRRSRSAEVDI